MKTYTIKLMTTSGQTLRTHQVPESELINALRAEGLTGREIGDGPERAKGMTLGGDARSDDHGGQYISWSKDEQVTARQAVRGTTVYITTTEAAPVGMSALTVREHAVVVGSWRPSRSLGLGYADLHDASGRFWITAAAGDLLHVVPAHQRRHPVPAHLLA